MSNKDWTDKLPELLDGFTETEPEGLWDAVQAGVETKKRRVIGAWWYAGGAMLAAAAVLAAVLLWPVKPSGDVTLVPGNVLAEEVEEAEEAEEVEEMGVVEEVTEAEVVEKPVVTPEAKVDVIIDEPTEQKPVEIAEEKVEEKAEEKTEETVVETVEEKVKEKAEENIEEKKEPVVIIRKPRLVRKPSNRVLLAMSTTGSMGQAATSHTTGIGIPAVPGTKAAGGGTYSASPTMFSRNKTSTSDSKHYQSARIALGIRYNLNYHWGIETGMVSTTIKSEINTISGNTRNETERTMTYLGIPLYLTYNVLEWNRLSIYLNAGPMFEFTTGTETYGKTFIGNTLSDSGYDSNLYKDNKWSMNAGAGLQLRIFDHSAVFVQPGFSYHFPDQSSRESFYTEHPTAFNFTFGYRILF